MIGGAIYQLINVTEVTDLVSQINYGIAAQENVFPRVVITESGTPENYKDGYSIINHDVEINIFASKGKDGNGGFLEASKIADMVAFKLYRYKGVIGGKRIDQTLLSNQEILFDNTSQCARVIMEYSVRENISGMPQGDIQDLVQTISTEGATLENLGCLVDNLTNL